MQFSFIYAFMHLKTDYIEYSLLKSPSTKKAVFTVNLLTDTDKTQYRWNKRVKYRNWIQTAQTTQTTQNTAKQATPVQTLITYDTMKYKYYYYTTIQPCNSKQRKIQQEKLLTSVADYDS